MAEKDEGYRMFSPEHIALLAKLGKHQEEIIDEKFSEGVPTDNRDIRVVNETIDSLRGSIYKEAELTLKHEDNENQADQAEAAAALLKEIALLKAEGGTYVPKTCSKDLSEYKEKIDEIDIDTVAGELEIEPEPLNPEDFVESR